MKMHRTSEPENSAIDKAARDTILSLLGIRNAKARFLTEVYAAIEKSRIDRSAADGALAELEREGAVMVRDHFCADPHLAGVDLRVATIVEAEPGEDPQLSAIRRIDEAWNKWLSEYLANHRCG
ncbi:MAG TPA: hypothetical protein VJQ55_09135 [Candidatus Binatia bacterium]|nr:hypothetical protein [Candidatus Binatia bacterium]